jgi:hypothetical protein
MDILDRFETRAIEDIVRDNKIKADNYESIGKHILIKQIRKAIRLAFHKEKTRSPYCLNDLLKPGKLFIEDLAESANNHPERNSNHVPDRDDQRTTTDPDPPEQSLI